MIQIYYQSKEEKRRVEEIVEYLEYFKLSYEFVTLDGDKLRHILSLTENGFEDIVIPIDLVNFMSRHFRVNLAEISVEDMLFLLLKKKVILKTPFIFDDKNLCVAYESSSLQKLFLSQIRKGR